MRASSANGGGWASELAARPGSSLPQEGASQQQTITPFEIRQQRGVGRMFFIAGVGYFQALPGVHERRLASFALTRLRAASSSTGGSRSVRSTGLC